MDTECVSFSSFLISQDESGPGFSHRKAWLVQPCVTSDVTYTGSISLHPPFLQETETKENKTIQQIKMK